MVGVRVTAPVLPGPRVLGLAMALASAGAGAALDLERVDGAELGIEPVLQAHREAAGNIARGVWLWGALGWSDPSGSYLYFTFHGYGTGFLFRRDDAGNYVDVSPVPGDTGMQRPAETRPLLMDVDNNGFMDIVHTGDETPDAVSLLNNGDGTWTFSRDHRLGWKGVVEDVNGDGYADVVGFAAGRGQGAGVRRIALNTAGTGFALREEPMALPEDVPDAVRRRVAAADDRFHMARVHRLDAMTILIAYGGAYGGDKFTYTVRNGAVVDIGLPESGTAHAPQDIDGDGDLDVVVQWGDAPGIYRQDSGGRFDRDTNADMVEVNAQLGHGPYFWDVWPVDFDEDGDADLVLSAMRLGRAWILENDEGVYRRYARFEHVDGEATWPGDVDGDGDIDLVVAGTGNSDNRDKRDGDQVALFVNRLRSPGADGQARPAPAPVRAASHAPTPRVSAAAPTVGAVASTPAPVGVATPLVAPAPSAARGRVPLPDHDPASRAWADWARQVGRDRGRANDHALIGAVTGDPAQCATAVAKAQAVVDADDVARNQYLQAGRRFSEVFETLSWCEVAPQRSAQWVAWARHHLGAPDGTAGDRAHAIWWQRRWSRDNPANNYFHAFVMATSVYAMATGDARWLAFLRDDRLPLMHAYYATTPEGGSREGTAYGESHREVLRLAKLWRDYDGTEVLPQAFIDNSIRYWVHATAPGHEWVALIGDQTRTHGRTDGYHRDLIDNALQLARDPEAIAIGRWQLSQLPAGGSAVFRRLVLRDYPPAGHPPRALEYDARGAGHFFARDGWGPDATYLYFTAGRHDEAHQQEDQGAFAVWADGRWQTTSDSPWTRGGIAQDVAYQNVVRFASAQNIHGSTSTLAWQREGDVLRVVMDLTPAVGQRWQRTAEWTRGARSLQLRDVFEDADAVFGFETPGPDDDRAPAPGTATAEVQRTADGFVSVIRW